MCDHDLWPILNNLNIAHIFLTVSVKAFIFLCVFLIYLMSRPFWLCHKFLIHDLECDIYLLLKDFKHCSYIPYHKRRSFLISLVFALVHAWLKFVGVLVNMYCFNDTFRMLTDYVYMFIVGCLLSQWWLSLWSRRGKMEVSSINIWLSFKFY